MADLAGTSWEWRCGRHHISGYVARTYLDARHEIEVAVEMRRAFRAAREWAMADRMRDVLRGAQVDVMDHKDGTSTWRWSNG